jgi:hypothetical protein
MLLNLFSETRQKESVSNSYSAELEENRIVKLLSAPHPEPSIYFRYFEVLVLIPYTKDTLS